MSRPVEVIREEELRRALGRVKSAHYGVFLARQALRGAEADAADAERAVEDAQARLRAVREAPDAA